MNVFESELKKGQFLIGECQKCSKVTWPPSEFCSICFGSLSWRPVREPGILIEFSSKGDQVFGIVEFEDSIRVMGTILDACNLEPGQKIRVSGCGFEKHPQFVFVTE